MSRPLAPRGHLPARIYWVRRGAVLAVALLLVFGIAQVLTAFGGSDGPIPRAITASERSTPKLPAHEPGVVLSPRAGGATAAPLSQPTGDCDDADVAVQPDVDTVAGGSRVKLRLAVTTSSDACTWSVSARTLAVRITQGEAKVWSSQDCVAAVRERDVVVRPPDEPVSTVDVTWYGHRSAEGCPGGQAWVQPGRYTLSATSLGGEPAEGDLLVVPPKRRVIVQTPTATPTKATPSKSPTASPSKNPSKSPSKSPTKSPSKDPSKTPGSR